ncbi:uncharacterized protein LOC114359261 isoform X2 [Ostrinia furnacalis]|uniref:uncharacterized protein LOC114359261 isoform X2 n=1 Tax=Ostrinia furnacalis TaxID=93504 RepID=UPI00103B3169|nr:uncharacterized protein LOC114359261 isoform X2 [Ostrinia furnacalis]
MMENSVNEGEVHESFRSPPRRRRSTFFERRDSVENIDPSQCAKSSTENDKHNQELQTYYEKLLVEKEQWKKEVNNRRNKYHDLRQQYQMAVKASSRSRISYSALSNEDIEFLKMKPNISKLVESQLKLHKSVKETRALYRRANELDDVILSFSEDKINKVTEYILENSTVEPVE